MFSVTLSWRDGPKQPTTNRGAEDVQKWANLMRRSWLKLVSRLRRSITWVGKLASALLPTPRVLSVTGSNALLKNHGVSRIQRSSFWREPRRSLFDSWHDKAHSHTYIRRHSSFLFLLLWSLSLGGRKIWLTLWQSAYGNITKQTRRRQTEGWRWLKVGWSPAMPQNKEPDSKEKTLPCPPPATVAAPSN